MKNKRSWDRILAAVGLCALFFLGTFSLYSIIPREHASAVTAEAHDTVAPVSINREMIQTVPVDSPIAGLTLYFSDLKNLRSDDVRVRVEGQKSKQFFFDGALPQVSEDGEAELHFSQAALAGQDPCLVVKVTAGDSQGFTILCTENKSIDYGDLTVDGASSEGSLVYRLSLLREYWTWRRTDPLPYFIFCLLLIKLAFGAKAWYEKKKGKTVHFPQSEKWWLQAVCGGFLLICVVFFARNMTYLGTVCGKPDSYNPVCRLSGFCNTVLALANLTVTGLISWIALKKSPMERVAAASVLVLGIFYMAAITPLSPPDEAHHYNSAYNLSNYLLFQWKNPEIANSAHFDYRELSAHVNASSAYLRVMTEWLLPGVQGRQMPVPNPRSLSYPIEYIPQAVGLVVGRTLNLNFFGVFYLGRLTNLLFFTACVYFAVKRIPRFKGLLALTALLPMTLHQAASYSYDTFINGMALLFIASLVREYSGEGKMTWKDFLWLLIPGALLTPAKAVYSAMLLPALLIPECRFGGRKQKWGAIAGAFLICVSMLVAVNFSSILDRVQSAASEYGEANQRIGHRTYSVGFVLEHPMETARIFWDTLKYLGKDWFKCSIGWRLSGMSLDISSEYINIFAGLLLLSVLFCGSGEPRVTAAQRAAFLICACLVVLLTMFGMFTGWTPDGAETVGGVQGRYFIPILPLLFITFSGNWKVKRIHLDGAMLAAAYAVHTLVISQIINTTIY